MTAKETREVRNERSRATSRQRDGAAVGLVLGCQWIHRQARRDGQPNSLKELVINIACLPLSPTGWRRRTEWVTLCPKELEGL